MTNDVVLITGLPALLARTVCCEILRSDAQATVIAVVRSKSLADARSFVGALPPEQSARVQLMEGDAAAIDLGLSGEEFKRLTREITRIHHCAQVTYLGVDRKTAERINLGATREAIELAANCNRLQCLVVHSTAHVSGDRRGNVFEEDLKAGQTFRSVVEETKARAEKVARDAMGRVPIAIVRPSTVVGDSRTGEVDRLEGPYLLVLLIVTAPPDIALPLLRGKGDEQLNLVPVDWVARAAVAIGRDARGRGRTFHLVDPRPLPVRRVFELVAQTAGRRIARGSIPTHLARAILNAPGMDRIAKTPRALLEALTASVTYDARGADDLLGALGIEACPPLDTYVDKLVAYAEELVRQRRGSKPPNADFEDPRV